MEEIILVNDDNSYNIPHMGKAASDWVGLLLLFNSLIHINLV